MDDQPTDGVLSGRVRVSDVLLMLGTLQAQVKAGTEAAQRTEIAVEGMARRVGHLEAEMASVKSTLSAVQDEQRSGRKQPPSPVAIIAIIIAAAAVIIPVLMNAYQQSGN